jgi:hypothetical protein
MIDDEPEPAGRRRMRRLWRWLAVPTALAFSAAPLQALAPQARLVAMCSGGGPVTMLVLLPPSERAPGEPHKPGGCGHALCARDREQPGRRPGAC